MNKFRLLSERVLCRCPQINALASLYKSLHAAVKEEVALVKQIFPSPDMVLNLLLQRLFEQRVQAALERLLELGNTPVKAARGGQSAAARQQVRLELDRCGALLSAVGAGGAPYAIANLSCFTQPCTVFCKVYV